MTTTSNPYRVLGIAPGADAETIHAAFRARARELHPDVTRSGDPTRSGRWSRPATSS